MEPKDICKDGHGGDGSFIEKWRTRQENQETTSEFIAINDYILIKRYDW